MFYVHQISGLPVAMILEIQLSLHRAAPIQLGLVTQSIHHFWRRNGLRDEP